MQKFSVTPIGTCRVHNPIKQAQTRYPIAVNTARVYGYTHTSAEALQQLRFMQGDKVFDPRVVPLIFRNEAAHNDCGAVWQKSDLQIVEISSAKKITAGDDSVQLNYLYRYFADFFAGDKRTLRFWSLVKRGERVELGDFLRDEPSYRLLSPEDRALLTSLRMEKQDFVSVKRDMAEMIDRLGRDAVVFVTHVNGQTPDGSTIPSREQLINWVRLAAEQLDVACFDPTEAMQRFGQERAMEHDGLDLTHFTAAFSDRVYAELHREHIGPRMEIRPDLADWQDQTSRQHLIADNIEALIRFDDFTTGMRRLYAELRKDPDALPLRQLRGKMMSQLGDFEGAIRDLADKSQEAALSPEAQVALLEAYAGTQQWPEAMALADSLLGDEHESGTIYACAASACEQLDRPECALRYWKQAFRHDRTNLAAALKVLTLLSENEDADQLTGWRNEVLEQSGAGTTGATELARWSIEHRDEALFGKVFGAIFRLDAHRAEALFDSLFAADMFRAAAACLRQLAQPATDAAARSGARLAAQGAKVAAELLEKGEFRAAHELAAAGAEVKSGGVAARTERKALSEIRRAIRGAYSKGDYPAVRALWADAGETVLAAADTVLPVALSLHKLGEDAAALDLLMKVHQDEHTDPATLRWTGRIAAGLGRYEVALPMYAALRRSASPSADKFQAEIERFFETAERRASRQLRAVIDRGDFGHALHLAELLRPEVADAAWLQTDLERLNRRLRVQLREIEKGAAEDEDRAEVLALLLRINPDDAVILRRSALEAMRKMRFAEAAELWGRLNQLAPGVETNARNLERCRILAVRQQKKSSVARSPEPVA